MADQAFYRELPFMIRRQDTDDCAVVRLDLDSPSTNSRTHQSLVSSIEVLFSPSITNRSSPQQGKLIAKASKGIRSSCKIADEFEDDLMDDRIC
jgi:hypothetical protein